MDARTKKKSEQRLQVHLVQTVLENKSERCGQALEVDWKDMKEWMKKMDISKESGKVGGAKEPVGFQEETGIFVKQELSNHALVISQRWPS